MTGILRVALGHALAFLSVVVAAAPVASVRAQGVGETPLAEWTFYDDGNPYFVYPPDLAERYFPNPETACAEGIPILIRQNMGTYNVDRSQFFGRDPKYSSTRPYGLMRYQNGTQLMGHKCTVKDMFAYEAPPYGLPSWSFDDWSVYENGQDITQAIRVDDANVTNGYYYVITAHAWVGRAGVIPVCRNGGEVFAADGVFRCSPAPVAVAAENQDCVCTPGDTPIGRSPLITVGNPIAVDSGTKLDQETDYKSADGLLTVNRLYKSRARNPLYVRTPHEIPGFALQWHGLLPGLIVADGGNAEFLTYYSPDGSVRRFVSDDSSSYNYVAFDQTRLRLSMVETPNDDQATFFRATASPSTGGEVRLQLANGDFILFRRAGQYDDTNERRILVPVEHGKANGYRQQFTYPDDGIYPDRIQDSFGRQLTLTWSELGWSHNSIAGWRKGPAQSNSPLGFTQEKAISVIALPDGTRLVYFYGATDSAGYLGRLDKVERTNAGGSVLWARSYLHEDQRFPVAITGLADQNGNRLSTYAYDDQGRAILSERAGGVDKQQVGYTTVNDSLSGDERVLDVRTVTNPLALATEYRYTSFDRSSEGISDSNRAPRRLLSVEVKPTADVAGSVSETKYSREGLVEQQSDPNGNRTTIGISTFDQRPKSVTNATGELTRISWTPGFDLPATIRHPNGLVETVEFSSTGQFLSRATGADGAAPEDQRRTQYSWGTGGRLLSINGPRDPSDYSGQDDVTTFTYDNGGNRLTMTNALGHVTTYGAYDANGNPGEIVDANGVRTQFAYDPLGRLLSSTVKHPTDAGQDAITRYDYDTEGRVIGLTRPETAKLIFDYDLAGRMTSARSEDGERIDYTYDAASNVVREAVRRVDGSRARGIERTFDGLSRMLSETLGPDRTTRWQYDKNGNRTLEITPRLNSNFNAFDALDRIVSSSAPSAGEATTSYGSQGNVATFKDGIGVVTRFTYNIFGDVTREVSPDRGTTIYRYDGAGDLAAVTDGRGSTVRYRNDILGRIIRKTPDDVTQAINYSWDGPDTEAAHRIGRLAVMRDSSGSMAFAYDHRGNLISQRQVRASGGDAFVLRYAYDVADRIVRITYPSGRQVQYNRDAKGRVLAVLSRPNNTSSWTSLAAGMRYEPFGPLAAMIYGNGLAANFDWGNDGRLATRRLYRSADRSDVSRLTYEYDADDNITRIVDRLDVSNSQSYLYDAAGRLNSLRLMAGQVKRVDYTYDNNGNRLTQTSRALAGDPTPVSRDIYSYHAGTNRLSGISGPPGIRAITYDGRGNTATETRPDGIAVTVAYDGFARLTGYQRSDSALTFAYNGRDDRVGMVRDGVQRWFVYDPEGRAIGEYGANGPAEVKAEFIWTLPEVGEADAFGGDDGLGGYQPLAIAAPGAQSGVVELEWVYGNHLGVPLLRSDAGGIALANEPDYLAAGFPGQNRVLPDLYYNRYRDFDPTSGRYAQADPSGLAGGSNPYAYGENNPIRRVDPLGLRSAEAQAAIDALRVTLPREIARRATRPSRKLPVVGQALLIGDAIGCSLAVAQFSWEHFFDDDKSPKSDCKRIVAEIYEAMHEIRGRMSALRSDPLDLFNLAYNTPSPQLRKGTGSYVGHMEQVTGWQTRLRNLIKEAKAKNCKIPAEAWKLAFERIPQRPG